MTRTFVPIFREWSPDNNPRILGEGLVEVPYRELSNLIGTWNTFKTSARNIEGQTKVADLFCRYTKELCPTLPGSIRPFLQRPAITVNCGAREGNNPIFMEVARKVGWLVAAYRFTLIYGGGDIGMMGGVFKGYYDYITKYGSAPGQHSIQVVPAAFVFNDFKSVNGLKPPNECLCEGSDIAVIWPEFEARQWMSLLRNHAVISLVGGDGTMAETFAVKTNLKTGLRNTNLYVVNTKVDGEGFYDPLIALSKKMTKHGFQAPEAENLWHFVSEPQDVFDDLIPRLEGENRLPDDHYVQHYVRDLVGMQAEHDHDKIEYNRKKQRQMQEAREKAFAEYQRGPNPRQVVSQGIMASREAVGARAGMTAQDKLEL